MSELPGFTDSGDLPSGIHQATLQAVLARFGQNTVQRRIVARRLERVYALAMQTGYVSRFIVFGSFVTDKAEPNDVDVFLLMDDQFDVTQVSGESALIFEHVAAQNFEGVSIFWIRRLAILDSEAETVAYWQTKRDGTKRGIVEVTTYD